MARVGRRFEVMKVFRSEEHPSQKYANEVWNGHGVCRNTNDEKTAIFMHKPFYVELTVARVGRRWESTKELRKRLRWVGL